MSTAEMKLELIRKIGDLQEDQVEEMYDIVTHHLSDDDWNEPFPISELEEAIQEADKGGGRQAKIVMQELKDKYELND